MKTIIPLNAARGDFIGTTIPAGTKCELLFSELDRTCALRFPSLSDQKRFRIKPSRVLSVIDELPAIHPLRKWPEFAKQMHPARTNLAVHPSVTKERVVRLIESAATSLENPGICLSCGELESMVDKTSLDDVLYALECICCEKADRINNRDNNLCIGWLIASNHINICRAAIKNSPSRVIPQPS